MATLSGKFSLDTVTRAQRQALLDAFAAELGEYLGGVEGVGGSRRRDLMARVGEKVLGRPIDARQFDVFLRGLHEDAVLQLHPRLLSEPAAALRKRRGFDELQELTVVGGTDTARFARVAAQDLVQTMFRIAGAPDRDPSEGLDIGIVSGSTIGAVVRTVTRLRFLDDLGLDVLQLPKVRVFPLNVSLAAPDQLAGNATILAFELAEKINAEIASRMEAPDGPRTAARRRFETRAEAYGLTAPLLVRTESLEEFDRLPQTFDVVRHTEPWRVRDVVASRGRRRIGASDTDLDLIVTGVGELPEETSAGVAGSGSSRSGSRAGSRAGSDAVPSSAVPSSAVPPDAGPSSAAGSASAGSTFYRLARQFDFPMGDWIRSERIVGDIAYTGIRSDGTPVPLRKARPEDPSVDDEYMFYTAARLPILEAVARDPRKAVILFARNIRGRYAIPALFASIAGERHRYASRLVTDEETAKQLLHY